jgi:23S rRNA (cytidine1920-2'-O)/16S rRNA (cytidine1409-2'-O)-methyltransferase
VTVVAPPRRFVSRGGDKIDHAIEAFGVEVAGRTCLDAGVSTGGFTDCLLQRGAARVVAVDVGYGQVHDRLRTDPRVDVHERTNIREVAPALVGTPLPDLIVADLSFIALRTVLAPLRALGTPDAEALVLVKPQFEAGRDDVGRGGVVRDPRVWRRVLHEVADAASAVGWEGFATTVSPLLGPAGNVEFLAWLTGPARGDASPEITAAVTDGVARQTRMTR